MFDFDDPSILARAYGHYGTKDKPHLRVLSKQKWAYERDYNNTYTHVWVHVIFHSARATVQHYVIRKKKKNNFTLLDRIIFTSETRTLNKKPILLIFSKNNNRDFMWSSCVCVRVNHVPTIESDYSECCVDFAMTFFLWSPCRTPVQSSRIIPPKTSVSRRRSVIVVIFRSGNRRMPTVESISDVLRTTRNRGVISRISGE